MERTESTVVQVSPDYENEKIHEMQAFGWSLQGRQEIHAQGDAEGKPANWSDTYVVKTTVHHYVKLHFVRSLTLPNLDRVRSLEADLRNLPFRALPKLTAPGCLIAFFGIGFIGTLAAIGDPNSPGIFGVVMSAGFVAVGVYWFRARLRGRSIAEATNQESLQRMAEIRQEAATLLSGT